MRSRARFTVGCAARAQTRRPQRPRKFAERRNALIRDYMTFRVHNSITARSFVRSLYILGDFIRGSRAANSRAGTSGLPGAAARAPRPRNVHDRGKFNVLQCVIADCH